MYFNLMDREAVTTESSKRRTCVCTKAIGKGMYSGANIGTESLVEELSIASVRQSAECTEASLHEQCRCQSSETKQSCD
jgi:hypothetical protein